MYGEMYWRNSTHIYYYLILEENSYSECVHKEISHLSEWSSLRLQNILFMHLWTLICSAAAELWHGLCNPIRTYPRERPIEDDGTDYWLSMHSIVPSV